MKKPVVMRVGILLLAAISLLTGLNGSLTRLNAWAPIADTLGLRLATLHGPLMIVGFLGTLISLERAVAARTTWAYAAPAFTALGSVLLILGAPAPSGHLLILAGSFLLLAIYARVYQRAPSIAVDIETMGAIALALGTLLWVAADVVATAVPLWLLFPVLTIIGERLELARVAFLSPHLEETVRALCATALLGACLLHLTDLARLLTGPALAALAVTMSLEDVARRTVHSAGGVRFAGACMLAGYVWLAIGALTWTLTSPFLDTSSAYEILIHSLGLGFSFSMILAHAPTILPALVHRHLPYHRLMWVPLCLLHSGLVIRVVGLLCGTVITWQLGGILGVLTILVFLVLTLVRTLTSPTLTRSSVPALTRSSAGLWWRRDATGRRHPTRRSEQLRRNIIVLLWCLSAGILAIAVLSGPLASWGAWLPLHTLLLGGIGSAITIWSAHFADTLLHRPALGGATLLDIRLVVHSFGSVLVLAGITASHTALALAGMSIVMTSALLGVLAIGVQYRRAVAPRLGALAVAYAVALLALATGALVGYLASWYDAHGDAHASTVAYLAHTTTMLWGFVGMTVLGTLTVLWPTMLRTKMEIYAPRWTTRSLPALATGTVLTACAGLWLPLAAAGTACYIAGVIGIILPAWRTARRVRPTSFATASTVAAITWLLTSLVLWGVGVSSAGSGEAARQVVHVLRVPLATGFALQILAAALSYLTPVMLGGGPATTRLTNEVMDRGAAWRVTTTNVTLALAVMPVIPWTVRWVCAAVAGCVAAYVVVGMGMSMRELLRRSARRDDDVVATTLTIGPPPSRSRKLAMSPRRSLPPAEGSERPSASVANLQSEEE